jgi:BlaI family transcriptional regulator, penicillinase repressor
MARPPARELTDRELQIMHHYWRHGPATAQEVRDRLADHDGLDLAYTTVATLVRILADKGFLEVVNDQRPFRFRATQAYEKVSSRLLEDLVDRVFHGSRQALLVRLLHDQPLSAKERSALQKLLEAVS